MHNTWATWASIKIIPNFPNDLKIFVYITEDTRL